jgi:hypothetical protein
LSTAYESADLILKLYDLRRETKMRAARQWYMKDFKPTSVDDVIDVLKGEHAASFRMVTSYWEMVAALVNNGAIDWKMLMDSSPGEPFNVFAKLYPYLRELRSRFESKFEESQALGNLEQVIMQLPHAKERLEERAQQSRTS